MRPNYTGVDVIITFTTLKAVMACATLEMVIGHTTLQSVIACIAKEVVTTMFITRSYCALP